MRMGRKAYAVAACLLFLAAVCRATAGDARGQGGKGDCGPREREPGVFQTEVPAYKGNVILGRPTDRSVTLSILVRDATKVRIAYGQCEKGLNQQTVVFEMKAGQPREIVLDGLEANSAYEYRILSSETGEPLLPEGGNGAFRTWRVPGSSFTFTVQADSHLDESCLPGLYKTCLANVLADKPDFHIDLGDTFMTGKHRSRETAASQYAAQRYYFGLIGHAAPIFLVIGNHDGEETNHPDAIGADGLAVWSCTQRKRFFPNPVPGTFYTGNEKTHPHAGWLQNYYAWTWSDALFVVLDSYWTSRSTRGGTEPWNTTIGKGQYDWLAHTLCMSKARYKFVFIHQLTGGLDRSGRGGAEAAALFEWGGHEIGGERTFDTHRAGWDKPIHSLFMDTGVNIVFHGHDHFFAHQERDGIVYQLVPQPAHRNFRGHLAREYGYRRGDFLPNSGHLRVRVAPEGVKVEYVRAATPDMARRGVRNGEVAFKYAIPAR